ncbi:MAG: 30S ribosomal protein S6 [Ruminococcus flavefaciens]|nr:30S ribosomal protein S6 [Ruminococcus flavefaciens]
MKQQFIGLKHCKCGISWMRNTGYFTRTPDMIFFLKRMNIGKKIKKVPVIKYKND